MTKRVKFQAYKWLQISDLHIFDCTDWNLMIAAYEKLAKKIKPDFLVITGDYRHKVYCPEYDRALKFLNQIVDILGLSKDDVFMVPGNHDADDFHLRHLIIKEINEKCVVNADAYIEHMDKGHDYNLGKAFEQYDDFVRKFYEEEINDERVTNPSGVWCVAWKNKLNILALNTSLISDGKRDHMEIADIKALSEISVRHGIPTIVLAHHALSDLTESHQIRIKRILTDINARAYLCGDKHQLEICGIDRYDLTHTIPCIVCGKSAVQPNDNYSDINVILYDLENDGRVLIHVYKWNKKRFNFTTCSDLDEDIDTPYSFHLLSGSRAKSNKSRHSSIAVNRGNNENSKPISIWLPDAEYATGKQTRFNSFTCTDSIKRYFDEQAGLLGVISVKGIGKTFVLQVKRVKSARKYWCLPVCSKPSVDNHWATERVSFNTYSVLKTDNPYDDLVLLWKFAIRCYIINYTRSIGENEKTLLEYRKKNKITPLTYELCELEHNRSLEAILRNIVVNKDWVQTIQEDEVEVHNLYDMFLRRRISLTPNAKKIAIFIDKVDQAVKQTNAEPPAECVLCKKRENYNECLSKHKSDKYCSEEEGCQSKNCCYGCEVFASDQSGGGLRVYEESNAAKCIHVNIWQYLQLALMNAAGQIAEETNGMVSVFYTIRQEAFTCENNRIGEQNQKIAGRLVTLSYTIEDHQKIFIDCIRQQDSSYLFDPSLRNTAGMEEYSFVGVTQLCHPYCKDANGISVSESVFQSIYRHSFDRSRDIQRYGDELTRRLGDIRKYENEKRRGEEIKHIIEQLAASLAYCSKKSESTVNPSYYTEKMKYLPNYWADNDNFENLLSLIDRNLLFDDDVKKICRIINGVTSCPTGQCSSGKCKRHPFSMLYNMGYLGYVMRNKNNSKDEIQQFLNANDITYFIEQDDLQTGDRVAYIIHPALSKTIESKFNKTFMHFSGFILGKGLVVESEKLQKILDDRKILSKDEFVQKYYCSPSR